MMMGMLKDDHDDDILRGMNERMAMIPAVVFMQLKPSRFL
jgi:hypothetical protein